MYMHMYVPMPVYNDFGPENTAESQPCDGGICGPERAHSREGIMLSFNQAKSRKGSDV